MNSATPKKRAKPRRVVVVCFGDFELLDIAGPTNVFTAATRLGAKRGYDVQLAAETPGPVRSAGGVQLLATRSIATIRGNIDTLLVPGGIGVGAAGRGTVPHLQRLAKRSRRVVGVCSGAFLLAEAGLIDNRRVATHWSACDALAEYYPRCEVDKDAIFVRDGRIWTSAGVTAGMDLALALLEEDLGSAAALDVARWLVMYLRRPGGQSQFSAPLEAQAAERDPISKLVCWIREHLRDDLSVPRLARQAGLSERHFARVFARETGKTPAAYVQQIRIEAARGALESSTQSVKEIANRCGFANPETLHRAFQREIGATPLQYRQRFVTRQG
ncbi:MAG: GlxA family transcriptional regulator [Myxococcota bacterium]